MFRFTFERWFVRFGVDGPEWLSIGGSHVSPLDAGRMLPQPIAVVGYLDLHSKKMHQTNSTLT